MSQPVIDSLRQVVADSYALIGQTHICHWNVRGHSFFSLHNAFEEQYTELAEHVDDIAERIRSLGFLTPGSMDEFKRMSRLEETSHLNGDAQKMLENLLLDHEAIIQILRHDLEVCDKEHNDMGTSDFLTALMEAHEKMAWMVRAHLA